MSLFWLFLICLIGLGLLGSREHYETFAVIPIVPLVPVTPLSPPVVTPVINTTPVPAANQTIVPREPNIPHPIPKVVTPSGTPVPIVTPIVPTLSSVQSLRTIATPIISTKGNLADVAPIVETPPLVSTTPIVSTNPATGSVTALPRVMTPATAYRNNIPSLTTSGNLPFLQWIHQTPSPHLPQDSDQTTLTPSFQFLKLSERFGAPDSLEARQYGLAMWDKPTLLTHNSCLERVIIHDYPAKYIHIWYEFPLMTIRGTVQTQSILNGLATIHPNLSYDVNNKILMATGERYEEVLVLLVAAVRLLAGKVTIPQARLTLNSGLNAIAGPVNPNLVIQMETELCLAKTPDLIM